MGIHDQDPEGSPLEGRRPTLGALPPIPDGEKEPFVFRNRDILNLLKKNIPHKDHKRQYMKILRYARAAGVEKTTWYNRLGWTPEDTALIIEQLLTRCKEYKHRSNEIGSLQSKAFMAARDLTTTAIPVSIATEALGIPSDNIRGLGNLDSKRLPFKRHPLQRAYPFVNGFLAERSEVERILKERNEEYGY